MRPTTLLAITLTLLAGIETANAQRANRGRNSVCIRPQTCLATGATRVAPPWGQAQARGNAKCCPSVRPGCCTNNTGRGRASGAQRGDPANGPQRQRANWTTNDVIRYTNNTCRAVTNGSQPANSDWPLLREALLDEYRAEALYTDALRLPNAPRPFANLVDAEARHAAALRGFYDRYGQTPPERPTADTTPTTAAQALQLAIDFERENAAMYDRLLTSVSDPGLRQVFETLRDASRDRHLPALERAAQSGPSAATTATNTGRGRGMGNGLGKGIGRGAGRGYGASRQGN